MFFSSGLAAFWGKNRVGSRELLPVTSTALVSCSGLLASNGHVTVRRASASSSRASAVFLRCSADFRTSSGDGDGDGEVAQGQALMRFRFSL
jgi:hypothetical protein